MNTIKITWKASFHPSTGWTGEDASATFRFDFNGMSDIQILESIYEQTNLYSGQAWNIIEAILPENRTHTALSVSCGPMVNNEIQWVGDVVEIDGTAYEVKSFGWEEVKA